MCRFTQRICGPGKASAWAVEETLEKSGGPGATNPLLLLMYPPPSPWLLPSGPVLDWPLLLPPSWTQDLASTQERPPPHSNASFSMASSARNQQHPWGHGHLCEFTATPQGAGPGFWGGAVRALSGSLQLQPAADSQWGLVETNHLQFLQVWGRTWELAFLTSSQVILVPVQGTPSENHSSVTLWLKLCSADPWHHLRAG